MAAPTPENLIARVRALGRAAVQPLREGKARAEGKSAIATQSKAEAAAKAELELPKGVPAETVATHDAAETRCRKRPILRSSQAMPTLPLEVSQWFANKTFTRDWLSSSLAHWLPILEPFRDREVAVLEVGAFEGRSAVAFLEYLPQASVTSIDMFLKPAIESRFDLNVASYGARLTKIKGRALGAMERLKTKGHTFDVIYLDAAKGRADAFAHSAAAWPLLKIDGVLIWDDLEWHPADPPAVRPEQAIRLFCDAFGDCIDVIHEGWQMIVTKRAEWPEMAGPD